MRLLLIDTCGDNASLALAQNGEVLRERTLPARTASAHLVSAIHEELGALAWPLRSLQGVCVVNGPGSFTGVRVGLAAAKGLCEVAHLRLLTLSRLEVLLEAGNAHGSELAVLDAGRGEFYVRFADGAAEELLSHQELLTLIAERVVPRILFAEQKSLASLGCLPAVCICLSAAHAMRLAMMRQQAAPDDVAATDANYVRDARALYAHKKVLESRSTEAVERS